MEIFGYKLSVILVVLLGAIVRIFRVKSKEKTLSGRILEYVVVFIVSMLCGLLLLQPVMYIFGFKMSVELFVALVLALSSDFILVKILKYSQDASLGDLIEDFSRYRRVSRESKDKDSNDEDVK